LRAALTAWMPPSVSMKTPFEQRADIDRAPPKKRLYELTGFRLASKRGRERRTAATVSPPYPIGRF